MGHGSDSRVESLVLGFILILLGSLFLLHNFTPVDIFPHIWKLWPLVLIILGGSHLTRWLHRTGRLRIGGSGTLPSPRKTARRRGWELLLVAAVILVGLMISSESGDQSMHMPSLSGPSDSHTEEKTLEQTFELDPDEILRLNNEYGPVTVHPCGDDPPQVRCRLSLSAGSRTAAERMLEEVGLTIAREDGTLAIGCGSPGTVPDGARLAATMDLMVPAGNDLRLTGRNGRILVSGLDGPVTIDAADHEVSVEDCGGPVSVATGKGDIRLEDITGLANAASRDGDISATSCRNGLTVHSTDGTVTAEEIEGETRIDIRDGKLVLREVRGTVQLAAEDAKVLIEEIEGPLVFHGKDCGLSVTNCYDSVQLEGDQLNVETRNIRLDLTVHCTASTLTLLNTLGDLVARVEEGSLTCAGRLYNSQIESSFAPVVIERCQGAIEIIARQADVTLGLADPRPEHPVSVNASGGNILLRLDPQHCRYDLGLSAVAGAISSTIPGLELDVTAPPADDPEGTIRGTAACGDDGQPIELHAEYADIRLEPAG